MPIHLIGEGTGHALPFGRTFFSSTLSDLLARTSQTSTQSLTLFLTDGATVDVCSVDEMNDDYMVIRTFRGHGEACGTDLNVIPYGLIYRIQISPIGLEEMQRVGFKGVATDVAARQATAHDKQPQAAPPSRKSGR